MDRNQEIIRTSIVGIIANMFLAAFKAVVGIFASSIAIIMDAVNNFSDALSSAITIIGTKLSGRDPDRKHPFGYGRIEYLSAIIIAIIILIAGVTSLIESVKKIIDPTVPEYTTTTLIVIVVAIAVKLVLGGYVKRKGEQLKSDSLIASGTDALFDAVVTLSTLVSAGIMLLMNVNLDGVFGTLISLVIIKAGVEMLGSPVSQLLGESIPKQTYLNIRDEVLKYEAVNEVNDIILNYYGPDMIIGSLNIAVPDKMSAREIHGLTRDISQKLFHKYGIIINIGIYATYSGKMGELQQSVINTAKSIAHVQYIHAFYFYEENNTITLDVIPDDEVHNDADFKELVYRTLKSKFSQYEFMIVIDHNYIE